jgi:GMP synthase (glutamine-hydrolysing)
MAHSPRAIEKTKHAVAVRHVAFEDLGTLTPVLTELGYTVSYLDAGVDDICATEVAQAELVIVLGGPIGANDEHLYPCLRDEIVLLERRLRLHLPTLGICLGAQLMARALGAEVREGRQEVGFAPITLTAEGTRSSLGAFAETNVLHWHGDMFETPEGATHLASTTACAHQAFSIGSTALALQFHIEVGDRGFERWLIGHSVELAQAGMDVVELRSKHRTHGPALSAAASRMLSDWIKGLKPIMSPE